MNDDLIKRSDAIDAVMNTEPVFAVDSLEPYQKTKDVVEALEAIPSADRPGAVDLSSVYSTAFKSGYEKGKADRPQGWIPCGERLPSEGDEFLITWTSSVTNGPLLAFAGYEPDALLVSGGKWHLEDDMREFKDVDVIAWMPLPMPWKGEDDE